MSTLIASLPRHLYCLVERSFIQAPRVGQPSADEGPFVPCSWFGLTSVPGRAWGLTVLLESGAVYSHLPPNAIAFGKDYEISASEWRIERAQAWECFSVDFALHEYSYLAGRDVRVRLPAGGEADGEYLFTAQHFGDGYSLEPAQAKQYHFIRLDNGRLTCVPANMLLVHAIEFTAVDGWPKLRRQTEVYTCERPGKKRSGTRGSTRSRT